MNQVQGNKKFKKCTLWYIFQQRNYSKYITSKSHYSIVNMWWTQKMFEFVDYFNTANITSSTAFLKTISFFGLKCWNNIPFDETDEPGNKADMLLSDLTLLATDILDNW